MKYSIDKNGFYGNFGGAFVPEMLYPNLEELEKNYNKIINEDDFNIICRTKIRSSGLSIVSLISGLLRFLGT